MDIRVQQAPFDFGAEAAAFSARQSRAGAVVTFSGIVRDRNGALERMQIEHYPGMTEKALSRIATQAVERWQLDDTLILHRHGDLAPRDMIMMVATAARHRKAAFEAAQFLMDFLKSRAPFWKKEFTADGTEWVESHGADEAALRRW